MPSAETVELRARTDAQLLEELNDAHQALFNLRFQATTHQLADVLQVRKARRRIARIRTLIREREILEELDAQLAAANEADRAAAQPAAVAEMATDEMATGDEMATDDEMDDPTDEAAADESAGDDAVDDDDDAEREE